MDTNRPSQLQDIDNADRSTHSFVTPTYASLYLVCIAISIVISWGIFAQFLWSTDASWIGFFRQAFASPVASLVSSDVILSGLIFLTFARLELKRLGMPANRLWLLAAAVFSIGVCCGLSLFLYQRETWLARQQP
jgi:hypothetical protein